MKVVTYDGEFFHADGGLKPPTFQPFDYDVNRLPGRAGVAHTRYATVGKTDPVSLDRNIQPVLSDRPAMATCSNGDLVNIYSQTRRLMDQGFSFQSRVDSKVIQNTLIRHLISSKTCKERAPETFASKLFESVGAVMDELIGAYSTLTVMEQGLLAFKDPHGIRPLCYACRKDESGRTVEWAFSSESSVFNYFGDYHGITEMQPGEAIFVPWDFDGREPFRKQIRNGGEKFCFFEFVYFARPDSNFKNRYVEVARRDLGTVLAQEYAHLKDRFDVVCGLPGTGITTGMTFASCLGLPYRQAIIKVGNKRSFQETSDEKRRKAIDDKFLFIRDFIDGQRIAIVDDSNVRGTTSKKIIERLYSLGAKEVYFLYFCPEIIGPCFYGIDTPDETRLIAFGKSSEEITKEMGCDGVYYISHDGLIRGLGIARDGLCMACVTRSYPTDVTEARERVRHRLEERRDSGARA
ncbi:MAG: hypothetical protein M5R36_21560 [Deltaproteobacteria bacterium]|nr:hypothetical protein [Deltaproteobacteria bacterium]